MPRDLPGFYFDLEKNRYFPIKGPIPGSSLNYPPASTSSAFQKSISKPNLGSKSCWRIRRKTANLLQARELHGEVITCSRGKCSFQEECQKIQASQAIVWKFQGTERTGDSALELIHVNINRPQGLTGTNILFAASKNGSFNFFVGEKVRREFNYGVRCMPDCVWPLSIEERERFVEAPVHLWRPSIASLNTTSHISCMMKVSGKHSSTDDLLLRQHLLITSLGSETSGGSVYTLNLSEPLDYDFSSLTLRRRIHKAASFDCTVWTVDCNSDGSQAVVGTNLGASWVDIETGVPSWVLRCKSDVLSLQLDRSGHTVLCGLRNGAIVTVDTREKTEGLSARLARHRIPYPSQGTRKTSSTTQKSTKPWIELRGNIFESLITFMPSSISCLVSLQLYDQYFLASSMDGSIRLYDHRLMQKGPVQLYEGNVNSHTRIQLGVDPSERFLMSGGEDCSLRLWSIKSGELVFENKFMNSIPSAVCWPRGELSIVHDEGENARDCAYRHGHGSGAWLGSKEGLFHMCWS